MSLTLRCAWTFRPICPEDYVLQCVTCGRHYLAEFAVHCINPDCQSVPKQSKVQRLLSRQKRLFCVRSLLIVNWFQPEEGDLR